MDLLKWLDDLYTTARNGRGVLLEWDADAHTGAEVEHLLRSYGVRTYARRYPSKRRRVAGVHVRTAQAKFADGLLRGYGIAVVSRQLSEPITPARRWGVPAPAQGLHGHIGDAMGVMRRPIRQLRKERY